MPAATSNPFETDLDRNAANHAPLTPLTFLTRAALAFPDHPAIVHGGIRRSWGETYTRCRRLASALRRLGIAAGDCVAVIAPNTPEHYETHFGVPMAGAVLNAINTRLDAATIAYILDHATAKILIADTEYADVVREALATARTKPVVIDICDSEGPWVDDAARRLGDTDYEALLAQGDPDFAWSLPADEWQAISLNYTSGTTGAPKGVVYHHRGAYLNALGNVLVWGMGHQPIYLWTLPMFHCNGWCFPWGVAAMTGTNVCLRRVEGGAIYRAFADHKVTHLCGAPIIMQMIVDAAEAERQAFDQPVEMMTAAAPPPAAVLAEMARQGIKVTHVYGLTETYGPAVGGAWNPAWDARPLDERAALQARQGVRYPVLEDLMVADPETLSPVPRDGTTIGEVFMRGNIVMKGYLKDPQATTTAFGGGWFHSGDLGVWHEDGYIELKDRSKDIIISGGENISSIEIESALYRHPAVAAAAVVARPDDKWGETPCAFVETKPGAEVTADELIDHCRAHLAHYKCPRHVEFGDLPKTSTGKIQKFILRERARDAAGS